MGQSEFRIVRHTDSAWMNVVSRLTDNPFHSPQYLMLASQLEGHDASPLVIQVIQGRDMLLVPLIEQPIASPPDGNLLSDAKSPYGFASPMFLLNTDSDSARNGLVQSVTEASREIGLISLFLRLDPMAPTADILPWSLAGTLVREGPVVVVDLTLTPERLWTETRATTRHEIQKLSRNGFRFQPNAASFVPQFVDIYHETMRRVNASDYYDFSPEFLRQLTAMKNVSLLAVVSTSDELAAGGIFIARGPVYDYFLGATNNKYRGESPSKLLLHEARLWAQSRGAARMNLGGGVGGAQDGILKFKAAFSPLRNEYFTVRVIVDEDRYSILASDTHSTNSGFFPAYRSH